MSQEPSIVTEEAIEVAMDGLCRRFHKSRIKQALAKKFGGCARSHETILARARERLLEATGESMDYRRAEALRFYESLIASSKVAPRIKLLAQERIDKLLGLEMRQAPTNDSDPTDDLVAHEALDAASPPPGTVPAIPQPDQVQDRPGGPAVG
jgi:hypothetical protein